uniref:Short coiled-coil protein n=1 Tax=Globodera rostochiensis TaxID=31243 RepID=A0A914HBM2_GLORO
MTSVRMEDIIPLADDESHPNALDKVGNAKPVLPLPEQEERKARLIAQILELQNTLQDLSQRVENVREESTRLRAENVVLGKYIKNLMRSTSLFQPTNSKEQPPKRDSVEMMAYDERFW